LLCISETATLAPMFSERSELSSRDILIFWMPLAATWLMMATEGPILAAVIARMPDPKFNLAAYGVAFSFAVLIEAPIIMIMSASTALVKDWDSFRKLRNFTYGLNALITAVMLLFLYPPVFDSIVRRLIGLPPEVADLTRKACWALLPWPGAIGYRRFFQGILIADNLTRRVAYGTAVRLSSIIASSLLLFHFFDLDGALIGGLALGISVSAEAVATRIMADSSIRKLKRNTGPVAVGGPLTYRFIARFYYPLALTSLLGLGVHPMVTFFLGKSRMSLESLAVMPVIVSLVFIFRSLGLSYQEVAIALLGEHGKNLDRLKRFAGKLALGVSSGLAVIAFTPASSVWFHNVSGLSVDLARFALVPTQILVLLPALTVTLCLQRGVLVAVKQTKPITVATAIEVLAIFAALAFTLHRMHLVGAVGAALALVLGRTLSNLYLYVPFSRFRKEAAQ
jgi:Na+-driven multidrug efflux pump